MIFLFLIDYWLANNYQEALAKVEKSINYSAATTGAGVGAESGEGREDCCWLL